MKNFKRLPPGLRRHECERIVRIRDEEYRRYQHDRGHYRGKYFRTEKHNLKERRKEERKEERGEKRGHGEH